MKGQAKTNGAAVTAGEAQKACIHCGKCTRSCSFLGKYGIDIGDRKKLEELAYHCFLCGKCTAVCPKAIDGREVILNIRRQQVEENGGEIKGYGMLLWEKRDYRFRNYRNAAGTSAFFPGCNFPSFYPKTTLYLARLLREEAGIGTVFDCCGKPVAELGMKKREEEMIEELNARLLEAGIGELIMACPNCYHFLKGRLRVQVTGIYEKLAALGLGKQVEGQKLMFLPCPERKDRELAGQIEVFLKRKPVLCEDSQCCGLGGGGGKKEPGLAAKMPEAPEKDIPLCTYCASCSGNLTRKGYKDAGHILVEILGTGEKPHIKRSLWNRIKTRYWKEKLDEKET